MQRIPAINIRFHKYRAVTVDDRVAVVLKKDGRVLVEIDMPSERFSIVVYSAHQGAMLDVQVLKFELILVFLQPVESRLFEANPLVVE